MGKTKNIRKEVLKLVYSGRYSIVQMMNNGPEQPYMGCVHNLFMILEDDESIVTQLEPSDPHARKGCKTYNIAYISFMGVCNLIIWKI